MNFEKLSQEQQDAIEAWKKYISEFVKPDLSNVLYLENEEKAWPQAIFFSQGTQIIKDNKFSIGPIGVNGNNNYVRHLNEICLDFFMLKFIHHIKAFDIVRECVEFVGSHNFFIDIPKKVIYAQDYTHYKNFIADIS